MQPRIYPKLPGAAAQSRPYSHVVLMLVVVLALGLTACDDDDTSDASSSPASGATTASQTTAAADGTQTTVPNDSAAGGEITGPESIDWSDLPYDETDVKVVPADKSFIDAIDNSNLPMVAQVTVGQEVTFRNRGRNSHNVIPEDDTAPWRIDLDDFQPGDEDVRTFDEPGLYRYYCSIHGTLNAGMIGAVLVTS
ncbi:MAG: hypothetical protein KDB86_05125 [Actinobacteria bacterium]|nr:hypothetical protein [Actinomycetota bacterium]MCB9390336.1 hypothetical protein [Acidimicrobiia bacterium]